MLISCWLCPLQLDDRAAYRRHLAEKHPGPCPRCRRVHTGKCEAADPKPGNPKVHRTLAARSHRHRGEKGQKIS